MYALYFRPYRGSPWVAVGQSATAEGAARLLAHVSTRGAGEYRTDRADEPPPTHRPAMTTVNPRGGRQKVKRDTRPREFRPS